MKPLFCLTAPLLGTAAILYTATSCRADGGMFRREGPGVRRDIQEPSQKALLVYRGGVEDLILQVRYAGATPDFAWIVPTPSRPRIGTCRRDLFHALSLFTRHTAPARGGGGMGDAFGGAGVQVLERRQVGYYDVSILDANDPRALLQWLNGNGYVVSPRTTGVFEDYIRRGWVFTALRIDLERAGEGDPKRVQALLAEGDLQPLRLTFRAPAPVYPLKISSLNGGVTELLLFLMTEAPVQAPPGYTEEYRRQIDATTLDALTQQQPTITAPMWLTRLSRRMPTYAMTEDLTFLFRIAP